MRMETRLAEASLDNVALRDPKATDHKTSMADLQKLTPRFDWAACFRALDVAPGDLNVNEPRFMEEVDRQLARSTPVSDWKTYLEVAPARFRRAVALRCPSSRRTSPSTART